MTNPGPPNTPVDLEPLDEFLMSDKAPDDSMGLSDLDGFLTCIVIGPDLIMPSEWLPVIWGGGEPDFETVAEAELILGTIMARWNEINEHLNNDPIYFDPVFLESQEGHAVVSDWAAGFIDAAKLRPDAWATLIRHPEGRELMMPILMLGADDPANPPFGQSPLPENEIERLFEVGEELIPECIIGIHRFWKKHRSPPSMGNRHERRASRRPRR